MSPESQPLFRNQIHRKISTTQPKHSTKKSRDDQINAGNSLFEYSKDLGSSVRSYFEASMSSGKAITAHQNKRNQKPDGIGITIGGSHIIKEQFMELPTVLPNKLQPTLDAASPPNFGNFTTKKTFVLRSPRKKEGVSISLGRSVHEWSYDIRENFCRGLGGPAS